MNKPRTTQTLMKVQIDAGGFHNQNTEGDWILINPNHIAFAKPGAKGETKVKMVTGEWVTVLMYTHSDFMREWEEALNWDTIDYTESPDKPDAD